MGDIVDATTKLFVFAYCTESMIRPCALAPSSTGGRGGEGTDERQKKEEKTGGLKLF
jgi:hypothetical protein